MDERQLRDEPNCRKSSTDALDPPSVTLEYSERLLPRRMVARRDSEDDRLRKSTVETAEPKRAKLRHDKLDPI
jgi:hypothetical protein